MFISYAGFSPVIIIDFLIVQYELIVTCSLRWNRRPDAGKDWRQEEKGTTEDEIAGWHHQRDGHELEYAPGVDDGQGSQACCSPWGRKESDMTEWLNETETYIWCLTKSWEFYFCVFSETWIFGNF